jgi:hypothetical protein
MHLHGRALLLGGLLAVAASSGIVQARPSFSGRWALVSAQGGSWFGKEIRVTHSATTLTIEFTTSISGGIIWGNGQRSETSSVFPRKFVYVLDGSETKITDKLVVTDLDPTSKAAWDRDSLVIVTISKAVVFEPSVERADFRSQLIDGTFGQKTIQIPATHTIKQLWRLQPDDALQIEIISVYDTGLSSFSPRESRSVMQYHSLGKDRE